MTGDPMGQVGLNQDLRNGSPPMPWRTLPDAAKAQILRRENVAACPTKAAALLTTPPVSPINNSRWIRRIRDWLTAEFASGSQMRRTATRAYVTAISHHMAP